jgi:hypothetical protein
MRRALPLLLLSALLVQVSFANDRVAAPEGFTWQEIPELKTAFLKPTNWFFKSEELHGHPAYYISKENLDNNREFQTGLTVFVYYKKKSAIEYAQKEADKVASKSHGEKWAKEVGPFKEFGCQIKQPFNDGTAVARFMWIVNPKTSTLYFLTFEAPDSDWDAAWKTGATIVDNLVLDDRI